jgi:CCR4-NOT transcription complex subunit 1
MLYLFTESTDERFKEILTRTLLEHVMVHRPHPWGILVTFIELLRNPKYEFWTRDFIRVAPEITLIMENVRSLPGLHPDTFDLAVQVAKNIQP